MPAQGIISTQGRSDRFLKFSTLLYFSAAHKASVLIRYDWICGVLTMELLQFYYSRQLTRSFLPCQH
jgi:hypothetical protein